MKFEILTEQNFNNNFGSHVRCESLWTEIDESVVDLLLYTRYKDEAEDIKKEILKGKSIPAIVGYIRKQTNLDKCPLCGSSFEKPLCSILIVDNKTEICSDCGTREELERFFESYER